MTDTPDSNDTVQVEDLSPTRKRLRITVPAETVDEKLGASMATLADETTLPGFRKGKAPRALLERRFGDALRQETKGQIIGEAYAAAVEAHNVRPVGEPEPAEDFNIDELEIVPGKPVEFAVEIEVIPDFDLPDVSTLELKRPTLEITDEMIQREVDLQTYRAGQPEAIEGDFTGGDRLIGKGVVTVPDAEEPIFEHDQVLVVYPPEEQDGKGQVLGLLVDDLESRLKGTSVGQTVTITTTGPAQHEREDIRGKDLTIEFAINRAERIHPAAVEDVVSMYGMEDENMLREQIRQALARRRDEEVAEAVRSQVYDQLVDMVDFPLPENLSENQVARTLNRARVDMLSRGMDEAEVEHKLAEMRADSEERALRQLKLYLILQAFAEHYEIDASEQEVNYRIAQMAGQRGVRPERLRAELQEHNQLQTVALQVREHKTVDRIAAHAKVDDISAKEWADLQQQADDD